MRRRLLKTGSFVRGARREVRRRPELADALGGALRRLESNAFAPELRSHKLKGRLAGAWAASLGYDIRLIFELVENGTAILLLALGSHDEVY